MVSNVSWVRVVIPRYSITDAEAAVMETDSSDPVLGNSPGRDVHAFDTYASARTLATVYSPS